VSIQGWYYLHTNGELIYKPHSDSCADIRDSDFARCMWPMDPEDREGAWNIAVEGLALGARAGRVKELADKWQLTDADAEHYAKKIGLTITRDGDAWCATGPGFVNLQESDAGFGGTKLEAMASLAKAMKVPAGTMWRATFADLLKQRAIVTPDGKEGE
jgi:hypothetical protein